MVVVVVATVVVVVVGGGGGGGGGHTEALGWPRDGLIAQQGTPYSKASPCPKASLISNPNLAALGCHRSLA